MPQKALVRLVLTFSFLLTFFGIAPVVQSCSDPGDPFLDNPNSHPDLPLQKFAAGRLGIVEPTFARSYLVVAYRYFAAVPLTKDEQFAASALWSARIGNENVVDQPDWNSDNPGRAKNPYIEARSANARQDWQEARKQVSGSPASGVEDEKDGPNYSRYVNCSNDALENAAITLNARAKSFGKDSPGVLDWLKAQDTVFVNCGNPKDAAIPDSASASLPEIFRFDREY